MIFMEKVLANILRQRQQPGKVFVIADGRTDPWNGKIYLSFFFLKTVDYTGHLLCHMSMSDSLLLSVYELLGHFTLVQLLVR